MVGSGTGKARAGGRGAADSPTGEIRSGNDQGDGLLPRHRELFAAFYGADAGRASADAAGLFSARLSDVHRRVAPDRAAVARDACRRPFAQGNAGGVWVPPAFGA